MEYRYCVSEFTNPYLNLATEELLLEQVGEEKPILFFWKNDNTIVIGKNQNPLVECDVARFEKDGGKIARRKSGGGAVFHDLGNLNFSILSRKNEVSKMKYNNLVIEVLRCMDIETSYNGRNDILVNGKKFSGNASYSSGDNSCQHGTLMIHTDIERMNLYLTPDNEKLARNYISSVKARVTNLVDIKQSISDEKIIETFIQVADAHKMEVSVDEARREKMYREYNSREWIFEGKK